MFIQLFPTLVKTLSTKWELLKKNMNTALILYSGSYLAIPLGIEGQEELAYNKPAAQQKSSYLAKDDVKWLSAAYELAVCDRASTFTSLMKALIQDVCHITDEFR